MQNLIFSIFPNQNFVDLGLFQFGWERCTPAHSFGPAARNHYLFHYILSGTGTLMADDSKGVTQTYSIKSMQGFMIFPNQITTYVADKQLPWEYVWLEFDGLRVKSLLDTIGQNFLDSLTSKGLNPNRIIVTSVLRTEKDVKRLRRRNTNASSNSTHAYGTTFDISWKRFQKVEDEDGRPMQDVGADTLKLVLAEVLRDLRRADRCYVKYEIKQACFHITTRK